MSKINTNIIDILQMHLDAGVDESIEEKSLIERKRAVIDRNTDVNLMDIKSDMISGDDAYKEACEIVKDIDNISDLREALHNFKGCGLYKTATNMVFADGNEKAHVMLIGEAPGANEDVQGIPFCGDSGKLLDKVIYSIGLTREKNAYISNTVFWRPPGNRRPTDEEIRICRPFVEKHIALIKPKILIMVGSTASFALFGDLGPVTKQRKKIFEYKNEYLDKPIDSVVTFHPSYLLRQPLQKKAAWSDMLFIKDLLNR